MIDAGDHSDHRTSDRFKQSSMIDDLFSIKIYLFLSDRLLIDLLQSDHGPQWLIN